MKVELEGRASKINGELKRIVHPKSRVEITCDPNDGVKLTIYEQPSDKKAELTATAYVSPFELKMALKAFGIDNA